MALFLCFAFWSFTFTVTTTPFIKKELVTAIVKAGAIFNFVQGIFIFYAFAIYSGYRKLVRSKLLMLGNGIFVIALLIVNYTTDKTRAISFDDELGYWLLKFDYYSFPAVIFQIYFYILLGWAFTLMIRSIYTLQDEWKVKQVKISLYSGILSALLGVANVILHQAMGIHEIPLIPDVLLLIFAVGFTVSLVKYEILDLTPSHVANKIIDTMADALVICNTEGEIVHYNNASLELTGYTKYEFHEKKILELFSPAKKHANPMTIHFLKQDKKNVDALLFTKGSVQIPVAVSYSRMHDPAGREIGLVLVIHDIRKRKRAEQKLKKANETLEQEVKKRTKELSRANNLLHEKIDFLKKVEKDLIKAKQKAEESDRLKSAFLANMSHEIRTPMNAIVGFTQLLQDQGLTKEKREKFFQIIQQRSHDLLHLINEILDISKIEVNEMQLYPSHFNLHDMLGNINIETHQKIKGQHRQVKLHLALPPNEKDFFIFHDQHKIKQIITNLLDNSVKHTSQGHIEFGYTRPGPGDILFFVVDTGKGIPLESQSYIFERFRQTAENMKAMEEGIGLGLSICKGLTDLMGGKIWLESEPGKGTSFFVKLSLLKEEKKT
jgi:PAS domain S-box-containing protein